VAIVMVNFVWIQTGCDSAKPVVSIPFPTITNPRSSPPDENGTCAEGKTLCGIGASERCRNLQTDYEHCGECGNACMPGIQCVNGRCDQVVCKEIAPLLPGSLEPNLYDPANFHTYLSFGDLNGDGRVDMVIPGSLKLIKGKDDGIYPDFEDMGSFGVRLSTPDGGYGETTYYRAWKNKLETIRFTQLVDFNLDGYLDLLILGVQQGEKSQIWLNQGNGLFVFFKTFPELNDEEILGNAFVDVNQDGLVDWLGYVPTGYNESNVLVAFGKGDGTFGNPTAYPIHGVCYKLQYLDWNRDGLNDVIVEGNSLHILYGIGNGKFGEDVNCGRSLAYIPSFCLSGDRVVVDDLNRDGFWDIVVHDEQGLQVLLGLGACNFNHGEDYPVDYQATKLESGDIDGDGRKDFALFGEKGEMMVFMTKPDGTLVPKRVLNPSLSSNVNYCRAHLILADVDQDGRVDLQVSSPAGIQVMGNQCQ
jgi:hypothetical protein